VRAARIVSSLPRRRILFGFFVIALACIGSITGRKLSETTLGQTATAEVTAFIPTGSVFRLYYNNMWSEPVAVPVQRAVWAVYRFPVPARLTSLRLDPTDEVNANVLVRSIVIRTPRGSVDLSVSQLSAWLKYQLDFRYSSQDGIGIIHTQNHGAYMMSTVEVDVAQKTLPLIGQLRLNTDGLLYASAFLAVVVLFACGRPGRAILIVSVILVLSYCSSYFVVRSLYECSAPMPPVTDTVGYESYYGTSKAKDLRALDAALLAAAALSSVASFAAYRFMFKPKKRETRIDWARFTTKDSIFLSVCTVVFAMGSFPPAESYWKSATTMHAYDFDSQSVVTWEYLVELGRLPWRDFWFPYAGLYDKLAPLYPYFVHAWEQRVLVFSVLVFCAYALLRKSRVALVCLCVLFLYFEAYGVFTPSASWRYFLSLSIVGLSIIAFDTTAPRRLNIFLGLWFVYVLSQEVSQAFYAVPVILCLAVAFVWNAHMAGQMRAALSRLSITAVTVVAATLAYIINLWSNSQLREWWLLVSTLNIQEDYSSWPADVSSWFLIPQTLDQWLITVAVALLCGGLIQAVWTRAKNSALLAPAAISLLALIVLQKQTVRPSIAGQVIAIPILGLAILITQIIQRTEGGWKKVLFIGAFAVPSILTCFSFNTSKDRQQLFAHLNIFSNLGADLRESFLLPNGWAPVRQAFFAPATFELGSMNGEELIRAIHAQTTIAEEDNIYVLGDNPYLYILLRKPIPFYETIYNQSPLFCQTMTVEWLAAKKPKYVFWDSSARDFDSVPNVVRTPLLFMYVMNRYVPHTRIGKFDVLRRREAGDQPAIRYWKEQLGAVLDLGYVPALSNALRLARQTNPIGMRYIVAHSGTPQEGRYREIGLRILGEPFALKFKEKVGVHDYAIPLDHVAYTAIVDDINQVKIDPSNDLAIEYKDLRLPRTLLY